MQDASNLWQDQSAALVIAHPGHELRIHHWLERARPLTFVLTDGSGHTDRSRLPSTTRVLERAGARPGALYGAMSDRELYRAILNGEHCLFVKLAEDLAEALRRESIQYVVGDAVEGVNPGHDVCRLVLNAAFLLLEAQGEPCPRNMEYPVEGPPDDCPAEDRVEAITLRLDDDAYQRKVEAAKSYPELSAEIVRVLGVHDVQAFRVECIRPVRYRLDIKDRFKHPCVYEWYGEKQVAAGIYKDVIRFQDHIAPISRALEPRTAR
jgi:hypothetical protein